LGVTTSEYSPEELTELLTGLMPEIPGYRVMRLIGRGGMSYVYLGVQESLDRQVAIKVIRPDALRDEVSKLRFEKEARTIAKLQHPCIVGIHEVGRTDEGLLFYVMPYLSKGHVGERDLTANEPRVFEVLRALLWALEYAHVRGVVHRDVKAENVLFDNADRPVLADFGIAINKRDRARITGSGFAVGSSPHMAPEQSRGERVDGRADLYSLGVLTYELLCGCLPYEHQDPLGLALMHAVDPVPRLPPEKQHWQAFIDGAMAKKPASRFADAQEMMAALDQVEALHGRTLQAMPAATGHTSTGMSTRWLRPLLAGVAVAMALLAVALFRLDGTRPLPPPADDTSLNVEARVSAGVEPPASATPSAAASLPPAAAFNDEAESSSEVASETLDDTAVVAAPLPPGARELGAARQQIIRRRLTQPAGDNALQSLRAARQLVPQAAELQELGALWLAAATPYISKALAAGDGSAARSLFHSAQSLAGELQLQSSPEWIALEQTVAAPLSARLQAGLAAIDLAAVRAARAEVAVWGIASTVFEPYWSQVMVVARPGERIRSGDTTMALARLPAADQPGLAMMATAVTRDDYTRFVADSGRPAAACRIRTARMTVRKRSWNSPGFEQGGDHPVVCVSPADAEAYAAWLGRRDKVRYRLPSAAEWQQHADFGGAVAACQQGRIACADQGTLAADAGPLAAPGLRAMHGNIRELAGCAACRRPPALGVGWRDSSARSPPRDADDVDAQFGYDDIGFRLVREVAFEELAVH
jgi:serine/threonine-protein kinase PpkA